MAEFHLPIALGILLASGQLAADVSDSVFIGELSLDGQLRHTHGILPIAACAKERGIRRLFVPAMDAKEAAVVSGVTVYPVQSLLTLFEHFAQHKNIEPQEYILFDTLSQSFEYINDFADIHGQEQVKRVMEIAAAGGHNVYMHGPPGAGKTMIARALPSILPAMTENEAVDVTKIYSVTGNLPIGTSLMTHRPFRSPHHTMSRNGLIGGGTRPLPGEISLAHRGVLFLDEFPEFPRTVLESLRQPMEDGKVTISRASGSVTYPASFMLVAAANPCPCGYFGSMTKRCTCLSGTISRYQKRISGPILDRIDLHTNVPAVSVEKLSHLPSSQVESSKIIRERVQKARFKQLSRFVPEHTCVMNADIPAKRINMYCPRSPDAETLLRNAALKFHLSARSFYRTIKVARTISDLDGSEIIEGHHIAEALQYRPLQLDT